MKTKAGIEKPLAEWTLQEIKDICRLNKDATACNKCLMRSSGICHTFPYAWKLIEKPKFTEQEIQDAKTIIRIFNCKCNDTYISRYGDRLTIEELCIRPFSPEDVEINQTMFPSVRSGERFSISEIAGDADA